MSYIIDQTGGVAMKILYKSLFILSFVLLIISMGLLIAKITIFK